MILVLKQNPEKEKVDSLIRMLGEKGLSTNVSEGESHTIKSIAGLCFKCAYTALAEYYLIISSCHDVLGGH